MVGNAADPRSTLAALTSLRRHGRLVLMGSMTVDLPIPYTQVMPNNWEIFGQFMYPASAYRRLLDLIRAGLLDLGALRVKVFPMSALAEAMEAAAEAGKPGSRRGEGVTRDKGQDVARCAGLMAPPPRLGRFAALAPMTATVFGRANTPCGGDRRVARWTMI